MMTEWFANSACPKKALPVISALENYINREVGRKIIPPEESTSDQFALTCSVQPKKLSAKTAVSLSKAKREGVQLEWELIT